VEEVLSWPAKLSLKLVHLAMINAAKHFMDSVWAEGGLVLSRRVTTTLKWHLNPEAEREWDAVPAD
jgi:hypothetical protein